MATRSVLVVLAVALMCSSSLVLVSIHLKPNQHVSSNDCLVENGCISTTKSSLTTKIRSRKLLLHNHAQIFKSYVPVLVDDHHQQQGGNVNVVDWSSLRVVPSGPDPLHHRGTGPKINP